MPRLQLTSFFPVNNESEKFCGFPQTLPIRAYEAHADSPSSQFRMQAGSGFCLHVWRVTFRLTSPTSIKQAEGRFPTLAGLIPSYIRCDMLRHPSLESYLFQL